MRGLGDPNDARRRLGPVPKGPAAPGMPGFGEIIEVVPQGVGTSWRSEPLGERSRWYNPAKYADNPRDSRSSEPLIPGSWTEGDYKQPSLLPGEPPTVYGVRYQPPQGEKPGFIPYDQRILALLDGGQRVELKDPSLLSGSLSKRTQGSAGVRLGVTQDDLLMGAAFAGVKPEEALNVYRDLFSDAKPKEGEMRLEYTDGTPVEQFIVNRGTGLPDDTPLYYRGRKGADRAETEAFGGTALGSIGQDPALASALPRGRSSGKQPETMVPYVHHKGGRQFEIRYIDPTQIIENLEIPASQRTNPYTSDSFVEVTLGRRLQEALQDTKTQVMPRSALEDAANRRRFLPSRNREGSLVGYIMDQSVPGSASRAVRFAEDIPEEQLKPDSGLWKPVYAPTNRGSNLEMPRDVPLGGGGSERILEQMYRVGGPQNRDPDRLRQYLGEALGLAGASVSRDYAAPWRYEEQERDMVNLRRLQDTMDQGFQVVPAGAGAQPISRDSVGAFLQQIRGKKDDPAAQLKVMRGDELVQRLVPERDQGGRMTGRFYLGQEQETGPAALIEDELLRKEAEKFGKAQGLETATLEGLAMALAGGGAWAPKFVPNSPANADPITALVAKAVLSDQELAGRPDLGQRLERITGGRFPILQRTAGDGGAPLVQVPAEIATRDSYARKVLEQAVHDMTDGAVPLPGIRERLQYQGQRNRGPAPANREFERFDPVGRRWVQTSSAEVIDNARRALAARPGQPAPAPVPSAPLQEQAARVLLGEAPAVAQLTLPGSRPTGTRSYWSPNPTTDALAAYMASREGNRPTTVRVPPNIEQLEIPLGAVTPSDDGQLSLPIALGASQTADGFIPSPETDALRSYMARKALESPAFDPSLSPRREAPAQLRIPFNTIDPTEVRRDFDPLPVGRAAGPYAGRRYYGLGGDASPYQQPMTVQGAIGGFDYGQMARGLDATPGSPEHDLAMAQLAKRVAARNAAQSIARRAPSDGGTQLEFLAAALGQ